MTQTVCLGFGKLLRGDLAGYLPETLSDPLDDVRVFRMAQVEREGGMGGTVDCVADVGVVLEKDVDLQRRLGLHLRWGDVVTRSELGNGDTT